MNISVTFKSIQGGNNMHMARSLYMTANKNNALRATQVILSSSSSSPINNSKRLLHTNINSIHKSPILQYHRYINNNNNNNKNVPTKRSFSSENKKDFYEVLGVSRSADKGTIKKAYFKLAKEYHPDRNKDDKQAADKFKEVTAAYEVLSDDKQRELYDNFGHAGVDPNSGFQQGGENPFDGFPGFGGFNFNDGSFHVHSSGGPGGQEIDAEDLFEAFFGGGTSRRRRPRGPKPGADLQMHVKLSFKEAVFGTSKDLHLRYQVRDSKNNNRLVMKERDVTVDIPAGIDTGMNLRLAGKGAEGDPGANNGNLFVQVLVEDDPLFKRDGQDVHTEVPISFVQAVLGGTVDVETLTGTVEMKIPKGCEINTKLLLRNKGIPLVNSHHKKGNHIVHLQIQIPKKINAKQEQLLRQFDEESSICGLGLSGRIAKAAGSAFESIFGSSSKSSENEEKEKSKKDNNDMDNNKANNKNNDKNNDDSDSDVEDEKKQQAQ